DLEIRSDETRVAPLDDVYLAGLRSQRRLELGTGLAFHAVHAFGAVELPTEVDAAATVHFLEEHHGDPRRARRGSQALGALDTRAVARHHRDTRFGAGQPAAFLHIDDDEHRSAHEQRLCWHQTPRWRRGD